MKNILRFYLKQLPTPLLVLSLGLLFVLIYVLVRHDITVYKNQAVSTSQSVRVMTAQLDLPINAYSHKSTDKFAQRLPEEQRVLSETNYQGIRSALHQRDYRQVNKLILAQWRDVPQDSYRTFTLTAGYWFTENTRGRLDLEVPYGYLVSRRLNVTPMVSDRSDAVNAVSRVLGTYQPIDSENDDSILILYVLLGLMCVLFGFVSTKNFQNKTDNFVHTLPVSVLRYQSTRSFLTIVAFDCALVIAIGLNIIIIALTPDHNFGSFLYPLVYVHNGDTALVILWQFYAIWLLLLNLWAFLLCGISLLISHWIRNPIANIFCLAVIAFAKPLSLLAMLPQKIQLFLPLSYTAMSDMVYLMGEFDMLPPAKWILIFIVWDILVWAALAVIIEIQERPLSSRRASLASQNR
ncbi:hypothetical protein [Schleiferilactobacillus perolens]|jgi:hypothetical protein|uniref:hypothetical protein n=1 Tax=Schleiferilactobacillus perolens TaxID=100468 RepID=UPI0023537C6B|nr:hypothetical protein [Schleiferilactobacillus perolens]MCI2170351.1 hypothetical protein [Schleiferilactobacillus perolens]